MRIVLTGGGTGGHFYPLIAVAEAIEELTLEKKLIEPEIYYIGPEPFDSTALIEHEIIYEPGTAGRMRRYGSILNLIDAFKTGWGIIRATFQLYRIYPDVVFSTGGYAAFPTLYAARLLRIPVAIYDADAKPGRVSLWSAKFAQFIGIAHPEAAAQFPRSYRDKIARVGHPIRREIESAAKEGGHEFLSLKPDVPTILILGGSQGARAINNVIIDALPELIKSYNVVHQTGAANLDEVTKISQLVLHGSMHDERYRPFGLLNALALRMAAGISSVVISRAGSGTIFEIASWGVPSILIPIPLDVSHDQTENAFSYARSGAAIVIEQHNLAPHLLIAEIERLIADPAKMKAMSDAAREFARPQAAHKIATILLDTALKHVSS